MAASDSLSFPIKGQALRITGVIYDLSTGKPFDNLGTLTATVSKDGGNFASSSGTATEIQSSGCFYLDLSSTEMNANTIVVKVTAADESASVYVDTIVPYDISESGTHWRDQTKVRLEQGLIQLLIKELNAQSYAYSNAQITCKDNNGTSLFTQSMTTDESTSETRGKVTAA